MWQQVVILHQLIAQADNLTS